jgi:hypothetical protein
MAITDKEAEVIIFGRPALVPVIMTRATPEAMLAFRGMDLLGMVFKREK